jgi:hypothetical protein
MGKVGKEAEIKEDKQDRRWNMTSADLRELGQMNQCLYCLTQALRIDPSDVEALWEMATIHRAQDNKLKVGWAIYACLSLPATAQDPSLSRSQTRSSV